MSATAKTAPPPPTHVLETCLYVRSLDKAVSFYRDVIGLTATASSQRHTMFPIGNTCLLLFQLGLTEFDTVFDSKDGGEISTIPGHGPDQKTVEALLMSSDGQQGSVTLHTHYCLAVSTVDEVKEWEHFLNEKKVKIRGIMNWERGGRSVYFEDPDGHIGEIGSRGIWQHY